MGGKAFRHHLRGPGFSMGTWTCTHAHVAPGDEQASDRPIVNVVVEGLFVRHVGRERLVVDPTVALVSPAGEVWRSSHLPGCHGDRGVYAILEPDLGPRARDRVRRLSARDALAWGRAFADEGLATALVADAIDGSALPARAPAWVERAQRRLGADLRSPPGLDALAAELRVSPWHLGRTFRAVTGLTPRQYAERLRLAAAAARIAAGPVDLAELALTLGFSSHSHLSARFRAAFGRTPRTARS